MILLPPDELIDYIECDENGNWIYSRDMPEELVPQFHQFITDMKAMEKDKLTIFQAARRKLDNA